MPDYQNIEIIFPKAYVPNCFEEVFVIKKAKNTVSGHMLLALLKTKILFERFTKKNCKKQIKKSLESKKVIKKKR